MSKQTQQPVYRTFRKIMLEATEALRQQSIAEFKRPTYFLDRDSSSIGRMVDQSVIGSKRNEAERLFRKARVYAGSRLESFYNRWDGEGK